MKMNGWVSLLILAVVIGILVYVATLTYKGTSAVVNKVV